jgi:hypothetical protein
MIEKARPLTLALLAAACASSARDQDQPTPVPLPTIREPDSTVLDRPARSLKMTAVLDQARVGRAAIPLGGGTISVTGADGTRYTLLIPANALIEATTVALVPVASIGGRPIGSDGPAAAVQLEPEGLRFIEPATLRIEPARPMALAQQISFGWHGGGAEVHLEPLESPGDALVMRVAHFSGVGVGIVYLGDGIWTSSPAWAEYTPQEFEDRARQYLQELLQHERAEQLAGRPGDPELGEKIHQVMTHWYELAIAPTLARAGGDCDYARVVLPPALSFAHQAAILGYEEFGPPIMGALKGGLDSCFEVEKKHCLDDTDVPRKQRVLSLIRQMALLGSADETRSLDEIPACIRGWDGTFTSNVTDPSTGSVTTVRAHVTMTRSTAVPQIELYEVASGQIEWSISGRYGSQCTASGSRTVAVGPHDGTLVITRSSPPSYSGTGGTIIDASITMSCPDGTHVVPGQWQAIWFYPDETQQALPLPDSQHISGMRTSPIGSFTWDLTYQQ